MSEQALDLKRALQIVRRHWAAVMVTAAVGAAAGVGYTVLNPPQLHSDALVEFATSGAAATQVVIASSNTVLATAAPHVRPGMTVQELSSGVHVKTLTPNIMSITSQAKTASEAEAMANSVARSYVDYVTSGHSPSGQVHAQVLQPATSATGRPLPVAMIISGVVGALAGVLLGSVGALAINRRDRRLRERDEIADAIGVPVLASFPVGHPVDSAGWIRLLTEYDPVAVDAWRLRGALRRFGQGDIPGVSPQGRRSTVTVLSLRSDPGAMALGPQVAVFAASLGIRTALMIGPQQSPAATAALRAACGMLPAMPSRASQFLTTVVRDEDNPIDQPSAQLTVVVSVVDEKSPQIADPLRTRITVLGVSAGVVTAEDMARVMVSAADAGRKITGILVADPEATDRTTGRMPQPARTRSRRPTRLTGIPTETQQRMTDGG